MISEHMLNHQKYVLKDNNNIRNIIIRNTKKFRNSQNKHNLKRQTLCQVRK